MSESAEASFEKEASAQCPSKSGAIVYVCTACRAETEEFVSKCSACDCRVLLKKPPAQYAEQVVSTE